MDKLLKIVLMLTAVDNMSAAVGSAVGKSITEMDKLKHSFAKGATQFEVGTSIVGALKPAVNAFMTLEDSQTSLETLMMDSNGRVGESFAKVAELAVGLGNKLPGTTADFNDLFAALQKNGLDANNILSGTGKAAAYLAVALKMPSQQAGEMAAQLKIATGVTDGQTEAFFDLINRIDQVGVKSIDMQYAFAKSAGTLKLFGLQGLDSSKQVANVFAQLARAGMSGETIGTSFSKMLLDMTDPKKYAAAKDAAAQFGVDLKFFDKGKFLGVENMVEQMGKLKNLSLGAKASITDALTGGGQDGQVMLQLINNGVEGYKKMDGELVKHASLNTQVEKQLTTLKNIWESTVGTVENMLAALGKGLAPELKAVADLFGRVAGAVQEFLSANPNFAKFLGLAVASIGIFISVVGVINMVKSAFAMLRLVMLANPFMLIATVAILAIALIYSNWGKISAFFVKLWDRVKGFFFAAWEWIKNMFLNYTPQGLIIKHWDKISAFFTELWKNVKQIFIGFVEFVLSLGGRFFDAGKNIVKSIWSGIKSMANKPVEAIKDITKAIRAYLPFSPAKEGALKDIHKIRLVETIADTMKADPMLRQIDKITSQIRDAMGFNFSGAPGFTRGSGGGFVPAFANGGGSGGGGNISNSKSFNGGGSTVNFNIYTSGGGDARNIIAELRKYAPELVKLIDKQRDKDNEKKF